MSYIGCETQKIEIKKYSCSHPLVLNIHEYFNSIISLILKDGNRIEFFGESRLQDAESYLTTLKLK